MNGISRLKDVRKAAGLNQTKLATRLGVTQPTISSWENGESSPDMDDIVALCKFFQ